MSPDLVGLADVLLAKTRLGRPLRLLRETGSTNDDAKEGARDGAPHGALWVAETQTSGRGRQGRTWVSPAGENLLFSVLLRIPCPARRVPPLALVCGLAVRDAVAACLPDPSRVLVKWPNDVVVRHGEGWRKIAGILVESAVVGTKVEYIVVGIGLNVHTRVFPEGLEATSVALETERPVSRADLLGDVLERLDHDLEHAAHRGLGLMHGRLVAHDALRGRAVDVEGALGTGAGIDLDGRLLVESGGRVVPVASGEVSLRRAPRA